MKIATLGVALVALILVPSTASCQSKSSVTSEAKPELPNVPNRTFHPKLPLQDALKIAEQFIASERINVSHFWLYRANFILFGDPATADEKKVPGWHFWWVSDSGEIGNYVEIFVSMDGNCVRLPSM